MRQVFFFSIILSLLRRPIWVQISIALLHKCKCWDTPSENTGIWQITKRCPCLNTNFEHTLALLLVSKFPWKKWQLLFTAWLLVMVYWLMQLYHVTINNVWALTLLYTSDAYNYCTFGGLSVSMKKECRYWHLFCAI